MISSELIITRSSYLSPRIINRMQSFCLYVFTVFFTGYVQGMSDLLAPILVVMENEVDAFWCFAGFMERVVSKVRDGLFEKRS